MCEPLPSRKTELHAMSRQKTTVAVGLLAGHTTLTVHIFKLGLIAAGLLTVRGQK
jgi:hypothetical protein